MGGMRRTLRVLGLIGVVTAAGAAAVRRMATGAPDRAEVTNLNPVSDELQQALSRFEERFGT